MKTIKRLLVAGVAALFALAAPLAIAGEDLNVTNVISQTTLSFISFPTNTISTNGLPQQTGGPIHIYLQKDFGFQLQGVTYNFTNAAAINIGVLLVGSMANNQPQVYSNSVVDQRNDWNTTNEVMNWFVIPVLTTNGAINWQTNIPSTATLSQCNWVGVYQITNGFTTTEGLTNVHMFINKKITPVGLVGLPAQ